MTRPESIADHAAIDFGTSNSALAMTVGHQKVELVALEAGWTTMPTAVFYRADPDLPGADPVALFGRAALAAYVEGHEGRLMRSMKSILGSTLVDQATDVGAGRSVRYLDVIAGYLRHLRQIAERRAGAPVRRVVLGRPVFFVDDDAGRDAQAAAALTAAARQVGFDEVGFQYEPIAAAFAYEAGVTAETLVLVVDIGGGTSDFSLLRVGPRRRARLERQDDILANHGVHVAGTDFDRRLELAAILPLAGLGALGPAAPGQAAREVPSGLYHDLATWHLINTCYTPSRVAEWRRMRGWFAEPALHRRLMRVLDGRLGHGLAAAAEQAKIDVALQGRAEIDLGSLERGLASRLDSGPAAAAIDGDLDRIVAAAVQTVRLAGVPAKDVQALYFTGGSTGLAPLVERIGAAFPNAEPVRGDRFASVATGLGLHAQRLFSGA